MRLIFIIIFCVFIVSGCDANEYGQIQRRLNVHLSELDNDPRNCHLLSQIAGAYGELYDIDNQILYYEKTIRHCPEDFLSRFQLGVAYFINKNHQAGVKLMDEAINDAMKYEKHDLAEALRKEKLMWIEKKELVEDIDWKSIRNSSKQ